MRNIAFSLLLAGVGIAILTITLSRLSISTQDELSSSGGEDCDALVPLQSTSDPVFDFGYVETSSRTRARIALQSKKPLTISRVRSDCICIQVHGHPSALSSGSPDIMDIGFQAPPNAERYSGKILLVTEQDKPIVIRITADVGMPLKAPQVLDAGPLRAGGVYTVPLVIVNRGSSPCRLAYILTDNDRVSPAVRDTLITGRGEISIPVKIHASSPAGENSALLRVVTDSATQPEIHVTVCWTTYGTQPEDLE